MLQIVLRKLEQTDYNKGYLDLLSVLTIIGEISESDFVKEYQTILSHQPYNIYVIEDTITQKIIATGTLLIEQKIIHSLGKVGHIEDIVVSKDYQGYSLGKRIMEVLVSLAKEYGCYKIILDCSDDVKGFYEKCGFVQKGIMMRCSL